METIPLEMDDLFDTYDDDDIVPTRLPDLDELDLEPMRDSRLDDNNDAGDDGDQPLTDNPDLLAKLKSLKGASKNVARKTFLKLDAERLTGERGIPVLPKIFKNVKLKGKHHEAEDLKTIMHHMEHWAHRLFPKMPFTEVLDRSERLGAKNEVKTCVKRIRLGMPVLRTEVAEDEEDVQREGDVPRDGDTHSDGEDERDRDAARPTTVSSQQLPNDDEIEEYLNAEVELSQATSQKKDAQKESESTTKQSDAPAKSNLSEEARARMERNKRIAMEKRAARLARANNTLPDNTVLPSPSSAHSIQEEKSPDVSSKDAGTTLIGESRIQQEIPMESQSGEDTFPKDDEGALEFSEMEGIDNEKEVNTNENQSQSNQLPQDSLTGKQKEDENGKGLLENENGSQENENGSLENENGSLENEKGSLENDNDSPENGCLFENEKGSHENVKALLENEHSSQENEKASLEQENMLIENEGPLLENQNGSQ